MKYLSVCSGVEAASQAWMPLGWEAVAFSEIEPFPCAVLASRFPNVPNLGDMSKIHYDYDRKELTNGTTRIVCDGGIDLLVGGTPCQSFSVAGKRAGLEGASGLAYHYARLIGEIRPRWFVWENVPGALSCVTYGDQRDFNFLLQQFSIGGNADLGLRWNCCWRVLDTQYVRVESFPRAIPQRRRRVFVVGHLATDCGGGCEVLLEREGVRGNPAPRRVKGQGAAGDTAAGVNHQMTGGVGAQLTAEGGAVAGHSGPSVIEAHSFDVLASQSIGNCTDKHELAETCRRQNGCGVCVATRTAIGFDPAPRAVLKRQFTECSTTIENHQTDSRTVEVEVAPCTGASRNGGLANNNPLVSYHNAVRRITPIEGERLQGFQDSWTRPCFRAEDITDELVDRFVAIHQQWAAINGKPDAKPKSREWVRKWLAKISSVDCPDGPRYKAIGNSMSVNVMNWIGQRINNEEKQ